MAYAVLGNKQYLVMKIPIEDCPAEGWTILNAIANCCPSWNEEVVYASNGMIAEKRLPIGGGMEQWFGELQEICFRRLLNARARRGDPNADDAELAHTSWLHYRLGDANLSTIYTPEDITLYDVRLFLPKLKIKPGRPNLGPWIRDWCRGKHKEHLPKDAKQLAIIRRLIEKDFATSKQSNIVAGYNSMPWDDDKALRWLNVYADYGYDTQRKLRKTRPAK